MKFVTDAANAMERLLKRDPQNVGDAREANPRILIVEPLAVHDDVMVDDCRDVVWQLWR